MILITRVRFEDYTDVFYEQLKGTILSPRYPREAYSVELWRYEDKQEAVALEHYNDMRWRG